MGAYGQFHCEWCRQTVEDQDASNHECKPTRLREHIEDLLVKIERLESEASFRESEDAGESL